MKKLTKILIVAAVSIATTSAMAQSAKSQKHAERTTELRQSIFKLLGSNMGPLGGMAKGKIAMNPEVVEKNAKRINQLSLMLSDYLKTDTSGFKVKTEALDDVWKKHDAFNKRIKDLTLASATLQTVAKTGDEKAIKKAIGGVGKTCGGCHDNFKAE